MSNAITFIIDLQDKLSAKVQNLSNSSDKLQRKFAEVTRLSSDMNTKINTLGTTSSMLRQRIEALRAKSEMIPVREINKIRECNREIKRLSGQLNTLETINGSWFKTKISDAFNSLPGAGFIANPVVALGAGIGKSISLGMENELQKQNITTLMGGDAAAADALFGKISDYGKATVYDKAGLIDAQKTMMSFGLSSEFAFDKLQQIGDIAMGDSQKMQSLSLAFSQATSAGKLQGQDLLQMINAGFNPLNEISKKTGESMTSLKERMSAGKISADELSMAFQWATEEGGLFYQGAEKAGDTVAGKWSTMKDTLSELGISIFQVIQPVLGPIIEITTSVFNAVSEGIAWVVDKIKEGNPVVLGLAGVIGVLSGALLAYKAVVAITSFVQNGLTLAVIKSNLAFLASPVFWIITLVVALTGVIVYLCLKVKGWGTLWEAVVTFAKETFYAFVDGVKLYFSTLVNGIMIGIDKIKLGWYKFKEAVGIGDSAENQKMIDQINGDVENRKKEITEGAKKVEEHAKNALNAFNGVNLEWDKKITIKGTTDKLKAQLGITDQSTQIKEETNNDMSKDLSTSSETISAGGKNIKNFNITINDGLVNGVQNYFNDSSENPETASDFMWRLSNALQLIVNDVNYAAE